MQFQSQIEELQLDNGIEFAVSEIENLLVDRGCHLLPTAPYHHKQNGIAKKANGLVIE